MLVLAAMPGGALQAASAPVEHHRTTSNDARDVSRELRALTTRFVEASRRLHDGGASRAAWSGAAPTRERDDDRSVLRTDADPLAPVAWGVRLSLLNLPPPRA
ncbi:MAG: hypothetical protein EA379_11725 [Phycisphaerales bacterium]|nr:MAG: hypothetical protein EA379_11725 [Phycisphaerales bacterium]